MQIETSFSFYSRLNTTHRHEQVVALSRLVSTSCTQNQFNAVDGSGIGIWSSGNSRSLREDNYHYNGSILSHLKHNWWWLRLQVKASESELFWLVAKVKQLINDSRPNRREEKKIEQNGTERKRTQRNTMQNKTIICYPSVVLFPVLREPCPVKTRIAQLEFTNANHCIKNNWTVQTIILHPFLLCLLVLLFTHKLFVCSLLGRFKSI